MRLLHHVLPITVCAIVCFAIPAYGEESFPAKPVRLVSWSPPGGTVDVLARMLAEKLARRWGQPVLVENKPGASGIIASDYVAKAAPDGHTLLITLTTTHVNLPLMRTDLPYQPVRDFAPVSLLALGSVVLIVSAGHPANSVPELIEWIRRNRPNGVSYGTWGVGTSSHLFGELLKLQSGLALNHVPYKGDGLALMDVVNGSLAYSFAGGTTGRTQATAGKVKVLGLTGPRRLKALPGVSTFAEQGMQGYDLAGWIGCFAPARTPRAVVWKISADMVNALQSPDVLERLDNAAMGVVGSNPDEFAQLNQREYPRWAELIRASGATAE